MKTSLCATVLGSLLLASPAVADHIFNSTEFATRGECEAENARLSNEDAERQFALRPDRFSSLGEARSFMTRAFTCEYDPDTDTWYFADHRREVLNSEWFLRRQ